MKFESFGLSVLFFYGPIEITALFWGYFTQIYGLTSANLKGVADPLVVTSTG
jgi:hypothetical protein